MCALITFVWLALAIGGMWSWYDRYGEIEGSIVLSFIMMAPIWGPLSIADQFKIKKRGH